jgi:glycine/betaine/sarcosine/D-proline reductase family selenoprotein B
VIAKEIERAGIPVALITALTQVAKQAGANRVITGTNIPHPCGDPNEPPEVDHRICRAVIDCALELIQTDVEGPTVRVPKATFALK